MTPVWPRPPRTPGPRVEPGRRDPEVGAREAVVSCRWPLWPPLVTSRLVSPSSGWLGVVVRTPTPRRPRGGHPALEPSYYWCVVPGAGCQVVEVTVWEPEDGGG